MRKISPQPTNALANTVREAGKKARLGPVAMYQLMNEGRLRYFMVGRSRRITDEAILDCMRQLEAEAAARAA